MSTTSGNLIVAKSQGNITTTEVAHGGAVITLLKGLAWTLVALGLVVILEKFVRVPPGRDSSAFLYVGKGILQGDIPYLDRWDHKGPLLYLLNAVGLLISGAKGVWGLWAMEMAILLGTVFCACKTFTRAFNMSSLVAMLIIVYFFHWSLQFNLGGNFTEFYALFFQFISIYIFYNKSKLNSRLADRSSLIIGACGGCAFLLRPNLVGLWLAIGIYWVARTSIRNIAMASVGGLATLSIALIAFALVGGSDELWNAMFTYNFSYVNSDLLDKIGALSIVTMERLGVVMSLLLALSWLLGLASCLRKRRQEFSTILEITVIAAPLEIALICSAGSQYQYSHYMLSILPVVIVLMIHFLYVVNKIFSSLLSHISLHRPHFLIGQLTKIKFFPFALCFFFVVNVFLILNPAQSQERLQIKYTDFSHDLWLSVAEYIKKNSNENDQILVWGAESQIYLYSDRDAPTRFFYQYPLITNHYTNNLLITEFTDNIIANKPLFIVNTYNNRLPPLDRNERSQWNPPQGRYIDQSNNLEPFFQFVDGHYIPIAEMNNKNLIYRYNQDSSS